MENYSGGGIMGIGWRFPATRGPEQLWKFLSLGASRSGPLDDVDMFDASFFNIPPREARRMDPQHRLLLETTWESLEDGGIASATLAGSRTGVFIAQASSDYLHYLLRVNDLEFYSGLGTGRSLAAGRISYCYDLRGPSVSIDSACSSSLTAVHMARQSILSGESTMAIVGCTSLSLAPPK